MVAAVMKLCSAARQKQRRSSAVSCRGRQRGADLPLLLGLKVGAALALVLGVHVAQVLVVAVHHGRRVLVVPRVALRVRVRHVRGVPLPRIRLPPRGQLAVLPPEDAGQPRLPLLLRQRGAVGCMRRRIGCGHGADLRLQRRLLGQQGLVFGVLARLRMPRRASPVTALPPTRQRRGACG